MPISTRVTSLSVLGPTTPFSSPESDEMRVAVDLEDGRRFEIAVATPDRVEARVAQSPDGYLADPRVVYVATADQATVADALVGLADEMSGYWLRRFDVSGGTARLPRPHGLSVERVEFLSAKAGGTAVIETYLSDARQFSILAATPAWWRKQFSADGLRFYFGSPAVFLSKLEPELARTAVAGIAAVGDAELCLFDYPRTSLPQVLEKFKARRAA